MVVNKKYQFVFACLFCTLPQILLAEDAEKTERLPNTKVLTLEKPLDEVMVQGIDKFALKELTKARNKRKSLWGEKLEASKKDSGETLEELRVLLKENIGAVDKRIEAPSIQIISALGEKNKDGIIRAFQCPVFEGVSAEGLVCSITKFPKARVIVLLDPKWTAEDLFAPNPVEEISSIRLLISNLLDNKCDVYIPTLIDRNIERSGSPEVFKTNIPHREWIYRMSFSLGRHIVGYEVQKVMSLCDAFVGMKTKSQIPIGVVGIGEGGQLALLAGAIDGRINSVLVSGYFDQRETVWEEPIYRNLWSQLIHFGDAELAAMIAPRKLLIEVCSIPENAGPSTPKGVRIAAAPGKISSPKLKSVVKEYERAFEYFSSMDAKDSLEFIAIDGGTSSPGNEKTRAKFLKTLSLNGNTSLKQEVKIQQNASKVRQKQQFNELVEFTQSLVRKSSKERDKLWKKTDRTSVDTWKQSANELRNHFYEKSIGRIDQSLLSFNAHSRKVMDEEKFIAYEVTLDVFPDVIAGGILLLPKDIGPNEKRPVVVCQHGLEGTPMDTISATKRAYKAFSRKLVERGFIVYAPQNPYKGKDNFRTLQRKSNPLGRSLYSYIIPQHQQTLKWLATLPNVDEKRIAFYGLSYGGKTAVRVPTMFEAKPGQPAYCLSICSGDFNEWVLKLTNTQNRTSYMFHGEYEMWEWNLANNANYAELSTLMTPRPFMVERGHRDGVAPDEWVAWEYAKVRRHYDELGIGDKTEIEYFVGGHEINEKKTYDFLHKHLNWPQPLSQKK